ncbi:MAG: ribonuclease HII [Erysipelotrichaceae bacterium]|nr:ribonuclease HII [Erysipelotrichaceae bacterium]
MKKTQKSTPNDFEHEAWQEGKLLLGIDEAGRGPLAGPLTVAGVIFEPGYENPEIYDSKGLSEKKRAQLYETIKEDAIWFQIIQVPEADIDRYDIYHADQMAMAKLAMEAPEAVVVTDAMPLDLPERTVFHPVKGDQKSVSVAAASILAKVTRDRTMEMYDEIYPEYGFAKNKGYPTKAHLEAIEKHGITPIHRRSFGPVRAVQMKLDLF